MNFKELMENVKKENGEIPKPIELLGQLDESLVVNHISDKKFVYAREAVPPKYKALIALSAAISARFPALYLEQHEGFQKSRGIHC